MAHNVDLSGLRFKRSHPESDLAFGAMARRRVGAAVTDACHSASLARPVRTEFDPSHAGTEQPAACPPLRGAAYRIQTIPPLTAGTTMGTGVTVKFDIDPDLRPPPAADIDNRSDRVVQFDSCDVDRRQEKQFIDRRTRPVVLDAYGCGIY